MTAGSQTVVNSVRPLKIGEKIREKLGENQEFFLFFLFWGPKIDFNPPFTKKKIKEKFWGPKIDFKPPPHQKK